MTRIGSRRLLLAVTIAGSVLLIVLTPFAFGLLGRTGANWPALSNIGQAYGGISALVSAVALAGVALSLATQNRQVRVAEEYAHREQHRTLLKMAMDDPDLMACFGKLDGDPTQRRQHVYVNLYVAFLFSSWRLGYISSAEARHVFVEIFSAQPGRRYWAAARRLRGAAPAFSAEFDALLDAEWERVADTPDEPGQP
jgi:hypothetical protein